MSTEWLCWRHQTRIHTTNGLRLDFARNLFSQYTTHMYSIIDDGNGHIVWYVSFLCRYKICHFRFSNDLLKKMCSIHLNLASSFIWWSCRYQMNQMTLNKWYYRMMHFNLWSIWMNVDRKYMYKSIQSQLCGKKKVRDMFTISTFAMKNR